MFFFVFERHKVVLYTLCWNWSFTLGIPPRRPLDYFICCVADVVLWLWRGGRCIHTPLWCCHIVHRVSIFNL